MSEVPYDQPTAYRPPSVPYDQELHRLRSRGHRPPLAVSNPHSNLSLFCFPHHHVTASLIYLFFLFIDMYLTVRSLWIYLSSTLPFISLQMFPTFLYM